LVNVGPVTYALVNGNQINYNVDGGPNTWHYDGDEVSAVVETPLLSTIADATIEIHTLQINPSLLYGVRGIIARSSLAKKTLDEDWTTPGSGSVSGGNLSISATTGESLSFLAGNRLSDFMNMLSFLPTQFNYTLQEVQSGLPYVVPPYALVQLYSNDRQDNILCGTQNCYDTQGMDYVRMRIEGYQPHPEEDGAIPFNNYWNGHNDNYGTTLSTPPPGYGYSDFKNGYILSKPKTGTIPVYVYFNSQRGDYLTVASNDGINYAKTNNYKLVNDTIGYFYINPPSSTDKIGRWIRAMALLQGAISN
jgi:hypothetical protein